MHSKWWTILPSAAQTIAVLGAIAAFSYRWKIQKWPALFASTVGELVSYSIMTAYLVHPRGHYNAYFYTYWISAFALPMLRLGIIADIIRSFPGIECIPQKLYCIVSLVGLTIGATSAYICYQGAMPSVSHSSAPLFLLDMAVLINRAVSIAWCTFGVTVLIAIKGFNCVWSIDGSRIAIGLFFRSVVGLIAAELYGITKAQHINAGAIHRWASVVESLCIAAVFTFWAYCVSTIEEDQHRRIDGDTFRLKHLAG
jgi:hypothetical protein